MYAQCWGMQGKKCLVDQTNLGLFYWQFIFQPTAKSTKGATQYLTWIQGKMCWEHRNYYVTGEFIIEYRNCDPRNIIEDFRNVYFFLSLKGNSFGFAVNVSKLE